MLHGHLAEKSRGKPRLKPAKLVWLQANHQGAGGDHHLRPRVEENSELSLRGREGLDESGEADGIVGAWESQSRKGVADGGKKTDQNPKK